MEALAELGSVVGKAEGFALTMGRETVLVVGLTAEAEDAATGTELTLAFVVCAAVEAAGF